MKEHREFTRQILAGIGSGSPPPILRAAQKSAHVLVAADHYSPMAVPVVKEALSLGRFGYRVEVLADAVLAAKIRRHTPVKSTHTADALFEGGAFSSVRAIIAAASPGVMAEVAAGFGSGLAAQAALWALWRNINVYMDLTCADSGGIPCKNEKLRGMYGSYKEKLISLGVTHVARGEVLSTLLPLLERQMEPGKLAEPNAAEDVEKQGKRVFITVKDVLAYTGGAEWKLPANAAVTAAAKDAAARRQIILIPTAAVRSNGI